MVATEKRYPRASFGRKLERICSRLDESSERVVEHVDPLGGKQLPHIAISSLWVVGSYARGALECGDLDLVMEYSSWDGWLPSNGKICKTFFGTLPLVRYYCGTPDKNTSGVVFPDAVLVWSGKGCDWKGALDSIQIDPTAGRAARETDCVPLRGEQLRCYGGEMVEVAELIQHGVLESEFIPFEGEILSPLRDDEMEASERRRFVNLGKKSQELIAPLYRLMQQREPWGEWSRTSNSEMHCGGSVVRLGRPHLEVSCFDNDPTKYQLLLVPHLSARGPNGAWILKRGANHPDVKAFSNRHVFAVFSSGCPDVIHEYEGYWWVRTLDLYVSRQEAEEALLNWEPAPEDEMEVGEVRGLEILRLLGVTDSVQIGDRQLALTWRGARNLDKGQSTLAEVVEALPLVEAFAYGVEA
ncbi:hypothetical protein LNN38_05160 [Pseudomonas sp. LA21]|uniref:hypothetical protein n=1 Tax=unclassified Pseudomonas TaxID=196821 RepID=UPI001FB79C66|nr:hypothetical protein [Pseudomonas sp. LA21]MCJ1884232.1 hypothetical protein [Pseudomonas sp. LA21]